MSPVEKLHRLKAEQKVDLRRATDRYESEIRKENSLVAQQNLLLGRELDRNNVKLDKLRLTMEVSRQEFEAAAQAFQETSQKWHREWTNACDHIQSLEEERINALKTSLWTYANILSQVCVTDDESCEKIRVSLETCDVAQDIRIFIEKKGTGQEHGTISSQQVAPGTRSSRDSSNTNPEQLTRRQKPANASNTGNASSRSEDGHEENTANSMSGSTHQINQYPLDGITQLCRSSSVATFASRNSSAIESQVTADSVYSSVPNTQMHTMNTSMISQQHVGSDPQVHRRKSFVERADALWPRRSPSPMKLGHAATLKAQKTGSSIFDALRPARSKSRVSVRTESPIQYIDSQEARDPRSSSMLSIGPNMLSLESRAPEKSQAEIPRGPDPIADALDRLRLDSEPASSVYRGTVDGTGREQKLQVQRSSTASFDRSAPNLFASGEACIDSQNSTSSHQKASHMGIRGLGAPAPAHSAAEMRQVAMHYSHKSSSLLSGRSTPSETREHFSGSNSQHTNKNSYYSQSRHAPGDLRRSPSPQPVAPNLDYQNHAPRQVSPTNHMTSAVSRSPGSSFHPVRQRSRSTSRPAELDKTEQQERKMTIASVQSEVPVTGNDRAHLRGTHNEDNRTRSRSRHSTRSRRSNSCSSEVRSDLRGIETIPQTASHHNEAYFRLSEERFDRRQSTGESNVPQGRSRSKSVLDLTRPGLQLSSQGREILRFVIALYDYRATIPEEIGFCQGDTLAIVETREDGWWIGEIVHPTRSRSGLVPSNFFKPL